MTCISGTSRGSTCRSSRREDRTNIVMSNNYCLICSSYFKSMISSQCIQHTCQRKGARAEQCEEKQHVRQALAALTLEFVAQQAHGFLAAPIYYLATTRSLKMAELSR